MPKLDSSFDTPVVELTAQLQECKRYAESKVANGVLVNSAMGAERCVINADAKALSASLYRLLDTVIMMTEKGTVTIGYEVYDSEVYLFVKSSGFGLTPAMCDTMFDESTYADMSEVKKVIESHGGEVGVESRGIGKGCTFWITLPADFNENGGDADAAKASEAPVRKFEKTILIAEDNENNYYLLYALLRDRYNILHANDGAEAVMMFQAEHPDIILMDISMPVLDGYEATQRIRAIDKDVPILAVTAYAFTADMHRIRESGFSGYISKPIAIRRLESELERLLAQ